MVVGLYIGCGAEPPNDQITIVRIELNAVAVPAGFFGGDQRAATAGEGVEHDTATLGAVENRIGTNLTGFTVGWSASSASRSLPKLLMPAYDHRLVR